MALREWIQAARKRGASDLHLESAAPPVVRVRGELSPIGEALAPADVKAMTHELLTAEAWDQFAQRGSADLSMVVGGTRCRINLYRTIRGTNSIEGGLHMAVRRVFGSLRASPELTECLLINWILRRNKRVCPFQLSIPFTHFFPGGIP